jgi:hypothetical protein
MSVHRLRPFVLILIVAATCSSAGVRVLEADEVADIGVRLGALGKYRGHQEPVIREPGSVASRAGLRAGDRILELDGSAVDSIADVHELLEELEPGRKCRVTVDRDGKTRRAVVRLGSRRRPLRLKLDQPHHLVGPNLKLEAQGVVELKDTDDPKDFFVCIGRRCPDRHAAWYRLDCVGRSCPSYEKPVLRRTSRRR